VALLLLHHHNEACHGRGKKRLRKLRNYFNFLLSVPEREYFLMARIDFQSEIHELNLAWLMLAQRMLQSDRETALFRLGVSKEFADFIAGLSAAKLVRMADNPVLIPCFRFDDEQLARLMAGEGRDATASTLHAAILAARRATEEAAQG
jgi:flagellar transcriptional activator FlhD